MALPSKLTSPLDPRGHDFPDGAAQMNIDLNSQTPAYAATLSVDFTKGSYVVVGTLTGNITVNHTTTPQGTLNPGQRATLQFTQDGTGTRTVTFGTGFGKTSATAVSGTASRVSIVELRYDGTNWNQVGGSAGM